MVVQNILSQLLWQICVFRLMSARRFHKLTQQMSVVNKMKKVMTDQ